MTAAGTHVVFGTGPAGQAVADALLENGTRARMVNRSGSATRAGVDTVGGDATDLDFARRETTPVRPTSAKSPTRAAMSAELLAAHQRGDVRVVIGRASDFVGPGVRDSALGQFVFQPALAGKRAQTMGRPDTQHTYSYVPDVGRNLVLLGTRDDAYGQAWHLPNPDTDWYRAHAAQPGFSTGLAEATTLELTG